MEENSAVDAASSSLAVVVVVGAIVVGAVVVMDVPRTTSLPAGVMKRDNPSEMAEETLEEADMPPLA